MEVDGDILLMHRRGLSPMVATFQVSKRVITQGAMITLGISPIFCPCKLTRGKHRIMGKQISLKEFINCKDGSK